MWGIIEKNVCPSGKEMYKFQIYLKFHGISTENLTVFTLKIGISYFLHTVMNFQTQVKSEK